MKNIVINKRKFQDIFYYIVGYFILNKDVPTIAEIGFVMGNTRQNIVRYIKVLMREGYLLPVERRTQRKYKINFNKLNQLREHNIQKLFIAYGFNEDPLKDDPLLDKP